jgi:hypothetical protein
MICGFEVKLLVEARDLYLLQSYETGCGPKQRFYSKGSGGSFFGNKAAKASG